jgi:hypothetical protein
LTLETLEERTVPTVVIQPHFPGVGVTSSASARYWSLQSEPVVLTFAGSYWKTTAGQSDEQTLITAVKSILGSAYLSGLTQYGSDGRAAYFAAWNDSTAVNLIGDEPTGSGLLGFAQREIYLHSGHLPAASSNPQEKPLYFIINAPANAGPGQGVWGLNATNTSLDAAYVGARFLPSGGLYVDGITEVFFHELAEGTVPFISFLDPGHFGWGSQIADNEPESGSGCSARISGVLVQAYWSASDRIWIVPDGSSVRIVESPVWNGGTFTGTYNIVSMTGKPQAGTIAQTAASRHSIFVLTTDGALWQHTGTDPNKGWLPVWAQEVTSISVGLGANGQDVVFADLGGALWEHTGSSMNSGWFKVWGSGVTAFSASQVQADTVFVSFGSDLWEHVGLDSDTGWTELAASGVIGFDAGVDPAHQAAVFVNLGGAVWEHTGTDPNAGWSQITTGGVTQLRASQAQADTVFVSVGADLWEHSGTDPNSGWLQVLTTGVSDFSAEVDAAGNAAVFVNVAGALWEHTGANATTGWAELRSSGVTGFSASQFQANTVLVELGATLWQSVGASASSGWLRLV